MSHHSSATSEMLSQHVVLHKKCRVNRCCRQPLVDFLEILLHI